MTLCVTCISSESIMMVSSTSVLMWPQYTRPTLHRFSNGSPPFMRIPLRAPTPVPTITAVGVARPRAQGQAITSTEMVCMNASPIE